MSNPTSVRLSEDIRFKLDQLIDLYLKKSNTASENLGMPKRKSISVNQAIAMAIVDAYEYNVKQGYIS